MTPSASRSIAVPPDRDWTVSTGIAVVGTTAAITSWSGLSGLAQLCGISETLHLLGTDWTARLAWLVPLSIDVYAVTAARVWLRMSGLSRRTRSYARANALAAVVVSIIGNAIYHWLAVSRTSPGPVLIVVVGAIAPTMLGLVAHLAALIAEDRDATRSEFDIRSAAPVNQPTFTAGPQVAAFGTSDCGDTTLLQSSGTTGTQLLVDPSSIPVPQTTAVHIEPNTDPAISPPDSASLLMEPDVSPLDATERMRAYWDRERASGRIPTGAELDRIGVTKDYGRRLRRQWLAAEGSGDSPSTGNKPEEPGSAHQALAFPAPSANAPRDSHASGRDTDTDSRHSRIEAPLHA